MNMKTAYKVYLFCCVLFLTGLFLLVPVYAVEDLAKIEEWEQQEHDEPEGYSPKAE